MTEELKGTVHYSRDGELAILRIDNPPVNPLSSGVRQGLHDGIKQALADAAVQAIVLTGEGPCLHCRGGYFRVRRPKQGARVARMPEHDGGLGKDHCRCH